MAMMCFLLVVLMLHSDWGMLLPAVAVIPSCCGHATSQLLLSLYGCASSDTLDDFDHTSWVVVLHSNHRRTSFRSHSCFLTAAERSRDQIGMDGAKLQHWYNGRCRPHWIWSRLVEEMNCNLGNLRTLRPRLVQPVSRSPWCHHCQDGPSQRRGKQYFQRICGRTCSSTYLTSHLVDDDGAKDGGAEGMKENETERSLGRQSHSTPGPAVCSLYNGSTDYILYNTNDS
jgi:hypothetical protein